MALPSLNIELNANTVKLENAFKKSSEVAEANMAKVRTAIESSTVSASAAQAAMDKFVASMGKASNDTPMKGVSDGAKSASEGMDKLSFSTVGARRELLVLAHEASQGNWSKFGGSLMVLGERIDAMSLIFSATGVAIGAAALVVGAFGFAAIKGAMQSSELANSLQITGNFAGITEGQFNSMSRSMANSEHTGIGAARDVLQGLVSTGQLTGDALVAIGGAAISMAKLSGASADDVAKDFAKMADGVIKWVDEHNKQYHFLSAAQYEHIRLLEQEGEKQKAMEETGKLVDAAMQSQVTHLGYAQTAWQAIGRAASSAWDQMLGMGRTDTPDDKIARLQAKITDQHKSAGKLTGMSPQALKAFDANALKEMTDLYLEKFKQESTAVAKAEKDAHEDSLIEAGNYVRKLRDQTASNADKRLKEIKEYNKKAELLQLDAATRERDIAAINEKWKDTKGEKGRVDDPTKAILAGNLQSLQDALAKERDELTFANKYVEELHKQGLIDQLQYEDYRQKALESGLAISSKAYDAEIAALKKYQAEAKRETDRAEAQKKIDAAQAKKEKSVLDLMQADKLQSLTEKGAARSAVDGIQFSGLKKANPTDDAWSKWIESDKKIQKAMDLSAINREEYDAKRLQNAQDLSDKIIEIDQKEAAAKAALDQQVLSQAASVGDQMLSVLKNAGQEKTALYKALFLANKAIAIAEILINTEVAAAKALGTFGPFGIPMAALLRGLGYASAAMVAGTAIASAENGYDIPSGVNPVTQLHEKEMVLPKAQAEVIRGLAKNGGNSGEGMKLTIVNNTSAQIGQVTEQRISANERALIIQEAKRATAADFSDPNSETSRAMNRNFNVPRSR